MTRPTPDVAGTGPGDEPMTLVGVGASAGGLRALQQFFATVAADSGMAYVVILHLDPERESRMAELLQDKAAIPVTQVTGPTRVAANHAYIIPPGKDLTVRGSMLGLRDRGERAQHAPIDLFFRTLAEAYGPHAVGVILSGTGMDGTVGIRYIREAGGVTVAQTPDEAEYDGMPTSAVSTGLVDRVLPAGQIPAELVRLRHLPALAAEQEWAGQELEAALAQVFATVRGRTGHDFSRYKRSTVLRRLARRLRVNNALTLEEYLPLLRSSSAECKSLMSDLLISVSSFFRDPDAFDALAALVPALFEGRDGADTVRVWVVGCATGEEVYSLGMVLSEYASTLVDPPRLQLFATDIDERGYGAARAGLYTAADVAGVTAARLERFFGEEAGGYRIAKSLRELVLFAGHNVLQDPPFSRLDLISCRNLFIYLQEEAQQQVLDTFHFALNKDGILFLGAAESVGDSGLFTSASSGSHRLFRRSASAYRPRSGASSADPLPARAAALVPQAHRAAVQQQGTAAQPFSYGSLHVRMLEQYAPPSVVVDEHLDVVHLSAAAGRVLRMGEGEPTHNLLNMAPPELRRALRTLLHEAFHDGTGAARRVRVGADGSSRLVDVQVRTASDENGSGRFALVIFDVVEGGVAASPGENAEALPGTAETELEHDLARTRDLLEATMAAHDRTVAELQTLNEELQSINEEQRAATEELETGREEIQAINEELTTINQEHQGTIDELKRTNADLQNLIESTEIGTIFLDRGMRIRRFTPTAAAIFNFLPSDQGRPLSDITHTLDYPGLVSDVAGVLDSLQKVEREVAGAAGAWFIVRINPYHSSEGTNEGAVLTFFDNSEQHRAGRELQEAKLTAEAASVAKSNFLSTLSHEFRTPLNAVLGYADLLQADGRLNKDQDRMVRRIKVGGWHLASMIDEILSFAKLDGGREVVATSAVDGRQVARDAGSLTEPAAEEKHLDFVLDLPDTPMDLVTDPGKARQILINLCANAVKYTPAGQVRLGVRRSGERIAFDVTDTGVGIAPEHLDRIFERFWQVENGATRHAGGMGIGLAAAREYARLLRGDVEVRSELGRGSTFTLWLPVDYDRR